MMNNPQHVGSSFITIQNVNNTSIEKDADYEKRGVNSQCSLTSIY